MNKKQFRKLSDEELVKSILNGNGEAYEEVMARYKNMIFGVALHILPDSADAEDAAQETFIDGFFRLNTLKEPSQLAPWLYGMAKRKALHILSRKRYHIDIDELAEFSNLDSLLITHFSPEDRFIQNETRAAVRKAVSELSEKNRTVTEMFYFQNLSVSDIAKKLSLSVGTVKSRLFASREKLKGELAYMTEHNDKKQQAILPDNFESLVNEKIKQLSYYYALNGASFDGFDKLVEEAEQMVNQLPDSDKKLSLLADVYMKKSFINKTEGYAEKALELAKQGKNGEIISSVWVDKILELGDHAQWIEMIDNQALPELVSLCPENKNEQGDLYFWRGAANCRLKNLDAAKADFQKAVDYCDDDSVYRACAICGIKNIEVALEYTDDPTMGLDITSETVIKRGNKLIFANQPGFTTNTVFYEKHRYDSLHYYISRAGRMFYDLSMKVGETLADKDGLTFTLVSKTAVVETPAGVYGGCIQFRYTDIDYTANAWYKENIGLVKASFVNSQDEEENYLLDEYKINGGNGYFPLAESNRWHYVNPELPDYLYQNFDYEIVWTDGEMATLSTLSYVNFKKDYLSSGNLDSGYYIVQCDKACDEWLLENAIDFLKQAIRANTNQQAVYSALNGIETLTRFDEYLKKGWRFCPSSVNTSMLYVKEGRVNYNENALYSFGPYRYGTRFEENRIFGVKPFRYLNFLMGCIYDKKWVVGYSENKTDSDGIVIDFKVTDGGTVTTPAGEFKNTLKVTVNAENPNLSGKYYFADNYRNTYCGKKEFWFAKGVGIVRFDFTWGDELNSSCQLTSYSAPAADDSYMPVQIGNGWEYDEVNLTAEGYRAKRILKVVCGIGGRYMFFDNQEFIYQGTEEEYEAFKLSLQK